MKTIRVGVPKDAYDTLPEQEKVFVFQISHFMNEIWILQKTILVSQEGIDDLSEPEFGARISQSFFFIKLLAGKLWEAWLVTSKNYLSLKPPYVLEPAAEDALTKLKKYFGKENIACYIRNKHAFHTDSETIQEGIKLLDGSDPLEYLIPIGGGIFCHLAETVDNAALLHHIDANSLEAGLKRLFDEMVMSVPDWFKDFGSGVAYEICSRFKAEHTEEEIPGVPKLSELKLSYFTVRP